MHSLRVLVLESTNYKISLTLGQRIFSDASEFLDASENQPEKIDAVPGIRDHAYICIYIYILSCQLLFGEVYFDAVEVRPQ